MSQEPFYIECSEDVRKALAKTGLSMAEIGERVQKELADSNVKSEVTLAPDPTRPAEEERDIFLLILASGVAVSLIGSAVARVIDAVTRQKAAQSEEKTLEVALDGDGNPVRDNAGRPVYNVTTKPGPMPPAEKEKQSFTAGKLLKFDFQRS